MTSALRLRTPWDSGGAGAKDWLTGEVMWKDIEEAYAPVKAQWEATPYEMGAGQQEMMQMLEARARGEAGPSAAEMQLQRSREQNIAALMAARGSQRGMAPGAAQRQLGAQMAQETQVAAGQAAQIRAQEQLAAEQTYAQTMMEERQLQMQKEMEQERIRAELAKEEAQREQESKAGVVGAVGSLLGFLSDRKLKKEVRSSDKDMLALLDELKAKEFKYKDKEHGKGKFYGVMAQDLEKSKAGKALVQETPVGKGIDVAKALMMTMAATATLNKRLKALEGKK